MKKLYFTFFLTLITSVAFGQASDLYFSMYSEGSSSNKFLEIYNGTGADVDLASYAVHLYPNGATEAKNKLTFNAGTTIANGDVYVIYNSNAATQIQEAGDISATVTYFNGDDAVALLKNEVVIDVVGKIGEDPGYYWAVAGESNGTKDHTLTRKSTVCSPTNDWATSAGTDATSSQWIITGKDSGWDALGTHTGCSSSPEISVTAPNNSQVFNPETVSVNIEFTTLNIDGSETVDITVNGTKTTGITGNTYTVTTTEGKTYTVTLDLVKNGSVIDTKTVTFSVANYTQVASLSELRAGVKGHFYQVTGEIFNTYAQSFRNQKWFQDNTAGIQIDDKDKVITTTYNQGDGIKNLKGQLGEYNNIMQLVPTADPGAATSTKNEVKAVTVTLADFEAKINDYESELIKVVGVTISDVTSGDGKFQKGKSYAIKDASGSSILRTNFQTADYIGTAIPTGSVTIEAIAGEYKGKTQIYPRSLTDFTTLSNEALIQIEGFSIYPNPVRNTLYINTKNNADKQVQIFDLIGKKLIDTAVKDCSLNINLPAGIYVVKVEENGKTATQKLIVK